MEEELAFFKRDNSELRSQIHTMKIELSVLKERNEELKETVIALKNTLKNRSIDTQKKRRVNLATISRSSATHEEFTIPELNTKTTAKRVFFRADKRAETNLGHRFNHSSLKTRMMKETSC